MVTRLPTRVIAKLAMRCNLHSSGHGAWARAADGSRLAGGDNTGKVTVWDTSSWTAIDGAGGKLDSPLWGLGFGGDDSAVVAADWHSIKDLTADNAFSVAKHDGIGGRFAVDPKTRKRIAARDYSDGTVTVLDWDDAHASSSFTPAWAYGTHWASPVADARFDPTGRIVVTLGDDGSVDAWSDTVRALTVAHEAAVPRCSIAVAAGRLATTSKESGGTDVWDLVSGAKVLSIPARVGATYAVDLNRAGNTLATLSRRTDDSTPIVTMSLYDAQGTLLQTRDLAATDEGSSATCVRFGPTPNTLTLLDARPRARRFTLELQRDSDDEEMVDWRAAIDASQRLAKITDTGVEVRGADAARRLLRRIPTQATRVAWSPDGTQLATSESDGTTHLWASEARSLLLGIYGGASPSLRIPSPMGADAVRSVDFSPSGAILAVATASGATNLFRLPGGSLALSLRSVADAAGRVAMTPSGHFEQLGADAGNFVRCFVGGGRVPLELCEETFEVRGLVAKVLADDASYEEP